MDNNNGGQKSSQKSSEQLQRETIARIARQKVENVYRNDPNYQLFGTADDLKKYHSAWQNYYQKYYGEYYRNAAQKYVEKERFNAAKNDMQNTLKANAMGAKKVEKPSLANSTQTKDDEEDIEDTVKSFKKEIQKKAKKRVRRIKKSRHFLPVVIAIVILLAGILFQYNQLIAANIIAYMTPGKDDVTSEFVEIDPNVPVKVSSEPTLIIGKLNIVVPITFGSKNDVNSMMTAMGNGVAHFSVPGASALPGELGNFVVSGHSAGNVYERSNYKFIFSGLTRMTKNDTIQVDFQGKRYTYTVTDTKVVEPNDVASLVKIAQDSDVPMITLLTCTPLGTSRYRLLVYGKQVSPEFQKGDNSITEQPNPETDTDIQMPSNSATPLEQFWNWLIGKE